MSKSSSDCPGMTGPTTCPLDLKSSDMSLPTQDSGSADGSNPKLDSMMDMIQARSGKPTDDMSGMTSPTTKSRSFS